MPVTSLLTLIEDFEGAPTFVSNNARYGGGQGASVNDDIVRQGTQSGGRRADNTTTGGLGVSFTAIDLSGAGQHIKVWASITQWSSLNGLNVIVASGSGGGAGDSHIVPSSEWPVNFGFIPVWIDVSRTADTGGPANEAAINECGLQVDIGDVGGNAQNIIEDSVHHGTSGYRWTGVTGSFADFRTFETNNDIGVFLTINGQDFCYARLEINDGFVDNDFSIIFPDQSLVSATFMGVSLDLDAATANIDLSGGELKSSNPSGATRRPDFLVTGTTRTLQVPSLVGQRLIQLTSSCTADGETLDGLELTVGGAHILNGIIRPRSASQVAMIDDATFGASSGIHDCDIIQSGSGHALEVSGDVTLTNLFFQGFGGTPGTNSTPASGANDAAILNDTGTAVEISVVGGNVPSIRNGVGATTTVVTSLITLSVTVIDADTKLPIPTARVHLHKEGDTGTVYINKQTDASGVASETISYDTDTNVVGWAREWNLSGDDYTPKNISGQYTSSGFAVQVELEKIKI